MSFGIMINSWNAQGGSKGKIQYLEHLISKSCKNILFLQEEGLPEQVGFKRMKRSQLVIQNLSALQPNLI